jgi:hypothetical protein
VNTDREHLDAETVAAWIDGGLDNRSLAAAEAHASNCDRCQALLATMTRTLPADNIVNTTASRSSFRFWKWLAPLAAAGAAVTLWMVVPQDRMQPERTAAPQSDVAAAPAAPSPVAPIAPPVVPARAAKNAPAPPATDRFAESRRSEPRDDSTAKEKLADAQVDRRDAAGARESEAKREVATLQETVTLAPPAAAEPARSEAPANTLGAVAQSRLQKPAVPMQVVAPDTRHRWRVLADTVEHSQDGGLTWIPVRLTAGDVISAGAAPSSQVCWLVGTGGLVLLATDGTNFTRLPFPERVDLSSVSATDARSATVTTADGRTFTTNDNGRNWRNP